MGLGSRFRKAGDLFQMDTWSGQPRREKKDAGFKPKVPVLDCIRNPYRSFPGGSLLWRENSHPHSVSHGNPGTFESNGDSVAYRNARAIGNTRGSCNRRQHGAKAFGARGSSVR